ncbi:COP23 domain-containing protein [Aerosakkonemataceae cyanobacterium BLCC-F50]|uniref:COP23 domain-containing protein n=1 Tax=Floridaenema flaviceps BLCC-F50 TaxID=3153642 RepID=A0ABV4XNY6_9CYAN
MKNLSWLQLSTAIAFVSAIATPQPSLAQNVTFFCGTSNGAPATIARTSTGEVPLIIWDITNSGQGSSPQQRCEEVATNFQNSRSQGNLNYITTERKDGQLVVCFAAQENAPCSGVLFPLNSTETNPRNALQRIFRIRVVSSKPINETGDRVYISLDKFLSGGYPSSTPNNRPNPRPQSTPNSTPTATPTPK